MILLLLCDFKNPDHIIMTMWMGEVICDDEEEEVFSHFDDDNDLIDSDQNYFIWNNDDD